MPWLTRLSICGLMPVAGVSERDLGCSVMPAAWSSRAGGVEHRFEVAEVGALGPDLGGDHDLVLVDDGLRVVALHEPAPRFQQPRVRVGRVHLALRDRRVASRAGSCRAPAVTAVRAVTPRAR